MITQLLTIAAVNAALSIPMAFLVKRDFAKLGRVSVAMAIWTGAAMHGNAILTFAVAWFDRESLGAFGMLNTTIGAALAVSGAAIIAMGRGVYASFARVYGIKEDELIDRGVYRWSRNPQYVGYAMFLAGVGIAAMSLWALALAAAFPLFIHCYIVSIEEPHLRAAFGEPYLRYLERTPRYLGIPSISAPASVNEDL